MEEVFESAAPDILELINAAVDEDFVPIANRHSRIECNADLHCSNVVLLRRRRNLVCICCRNQNTRRSFMEKQQFGLQIGDEPDVSTYVSGTETTFRQCYG